MGTYEDIGKEIGALVEKKNQAYGNAIEKTAEIEKIKRPDGVKPDEYIDFILDIFFEIKQCRKAANDDPFYEDTVDDLVGYGIQWVAISRKRAAAIKVAVPVIEMPKGQTILSDFDDEEPMIFAESYTNFRPGVDKVVDRYL